MSSLEHRYRRLIALYPAGHRTRYQMEMLSTLMDGASEDQRSPRFRESVDLVWNAIWLRLNRDGAPPQRDPRWATAATIFGVLGALTIAAFYVMKPLGGLGWEQRLPGPRLEFRYDNYDATWIPFAQGGAWLAVAAIAFLGWRKVGAILAWATVLLSLGWALRGPDVTVAAEWPLVVFGVTVAGCLMLSKGPLALRARHVAIFGGMTTALAASLWIDAMLAHVEIDPNGTGMMLDLWGANFPWVPGIDTTGAAPVLLFVAFLVVSAWIQYSVQAGVRRRIRAYAMVPFLTYVVYVLVNLPAAATGNWVVQVLVPLAAFGLGVVWVRRKDSQQRLIEIGRARS